MDTLLKVSRIAKKMKHPPIGQRLHYFFYGDPSMLDVDQINEIEKIIDADLKKVKKYLNAAKKQ